MQSGPKNRKSPVFSAFSRFSRIFQFLWVFQSVDGQGFCNPSLRGGQFLVQCMLLSLQGWKWSLHPAVEDALAGIRQHLLVLGMQSKARSPTRNLDGPSTSKIIAEDLTPTCTPFPNLLPALPLLPHPLSSHLGGIANLPETNPPPTPSP